MTTLRSNPRAISNYFDGLLKGIGHRGSSFTDIDALTHDLATHRFLFQEFKNADEPMNRAQKIAMVDLCARGTDFITVWCVRRRRDGLLEWCDVASRRAETISEEEYRARFRQWWENQPPKNVAAVRPLPSGAAITAADIPW